MPRSYSLGPADAEPVVRAHLEEVLALTGHAVADLENTDRLDALGLDTLTAALLITELHVATGVDPFARTRSLVEVPTVGEFVAVYREVLAQVDPESDAPPQYPEPVREGAGGPGRGSGSGAGSGTASGSEGVVADAGTDAGTVTGAPAREHSAGVGGERDAEDEGDKANGYSAGDVDSADSSDSAGKTGEAAYEPAPGYRHGQLIGPIQERGENRYAAHLLFTEDTDPEQRWDEDTLLEAARQLWTTAIPKHLLCAGRRVRLWTDRLDARFPEPVFPRMAILECVISLQVREPVCDRVTVTAEAYQADRRAAVFEAEIRIVPAAVARTYELLKAREIAAP
ncbi:MAG TPA: acyl carrier protein [Actinocrinis sp.]|nr:acyl carrier protein [Actinocrinis sp.]